MVNTSFISLCGFLLRKWLKRSRLHPRDSLGMSFSWFWRLQHNILCSVMYVRIIRLECNIMLILSRWVVIYMINTWYYAFSHFFEIYFFVGFISATALTNCENCVQYNYIHIKLHLFIHAFLCSLGLSNISNTSFKKKSFYKVPLFHCVV